MFWPFAIKAMAERMISLHVDDNGNTLSHRCMELT
jgi:hypothetical protein